MAFEIKGGVLRTYIPEPGVTEVTVPDGVKAIGYAAFRGRKESSVSSSPKACGG